MQDIRSTFRLSPKNIASSFSRISVSLNGVFKETCLNLYTFSSLQVLQITPLTVIMVNSYSCEFYASYSQLIYNGLINRSVYELTKKMNE